MERAPKRQFQPSISNYFHPLQRSDGPSLSQSPAAVIAASVQASLLNVGMRVRKAVPEGYKRTPASSKLKYEERSLSRSVPPLTQTRTAELAPFCGIHKIGGYACQELQNTNNGAQGMEEDIGYPLSSQESWDSSISTGSIPALPIQDTLVYRKHAREAEGDMEQEIQDAIISAQMYSSGFSRDTIVSTRRIAQPFSRKQCAGLLETTRDTFATIVNSDFEDAQFLQVEPPVADVEMDDDW